MMVRLRSFCPSKGWILFLVRMRLLGAIRPLSQPTQRSYCAQQTHTYKKPNSLSQRSYCAQQTHTLRTKKQNQPFDRQKFRSDGDCRQRVVARIISKLPDLPLQPNSISEMAESFTKVILDTVEAEVPPPPRRTDKLGWCETAETSAAFPIAWNVREDERRFMRVNPRDRTAWKTLCLLYTSPSPRDKRQSRMPSSA